jgi:hypothetical protein
MRVREIEVKDRVNKLIFIWDKTKNAEEFQKEQDPLVIMEIQKRLHNELRTDFASNLQHLEAFLSKKDGNMMHKASKSLVLSELQKIEKSLGKTLSDNTRTVAYAARHTVEYFTVGNLEEISEGIEKGILESFDRHQRQLIISMINHVLNWHKSKCEDKGTTTQGLIRGSMLLGDRGLRKGGKPTVDNLALEVVEMEKEIRYALESRRAAEERLESLETEHDTLMKDHN